MCIFIKNRLDVMENNNRNWNRLLRRYIGNISYKNGDISMYTYFYYEKDAYCYYYVRTNATSHISYICENINRNRTWIISACIIVTEKQLKGIHFKYNNIVNCASAGYID